MAGNQIKKSTCQTWQDKKQIAGDSLKKRIIKCATDTNLIFSFKWLHLACLKVAGLGILPFPLYSLKNSMPCFPLSVVEADPTHFLFHQVQFEKEDSGLSRCCLPEFSMVLYVIPFLDPLVQ